jgi:energy-coupling factor transport system substrate-specific component
MSWPLASFVILALALGGGFAWYERSRPSSRTVAVVATLAALATLGRIAFAPLPSVKPTTDIVLIAGFTLGGPPGFAVGAVAAIASNIVFGQGPWTPWQMLAWGMVGLLGAGLRRRRARPIPRLVMALICAAAGFAYGLVLNFYTFVTFTGQHTLAQFLVIEGAAFTFDLAHAVGNFVFFLAFGPALVRALQRFRLRMDVQWGLASSAVALFLVAAALAGAAAARPAPAQARAPASSLARASVARARARTAADAGVARAAAARAGVARAAAARAAAYLIRAENADGGFGLAPGQPSSQLASAWAVIGLAAAGRSPSSISRDGHTAIAWIRGHLGQLQGAGDVERTILALAAARAPLGTLVSRLHTDQRPDGSVAEQSNLTAFAILALRAADAPGVGAAALWLERAQNADGGFSFAVRGDPSDIDDTAAAIEALSVASAPAKTLSRARAYLAANENADGGFPIEPGGASNAQSTAWAVQALVALRAPTARALAYLRARLTSSGAVRYADALTLTPVWVTAEALAAFAGAPLPIAGPARSAGPRSVA